MAVFRHFTDDGISGTRFDRPGFQNMIAEVRAGNVEAVVIKDMSRFGRDYLEVGSYMEVLRKNDTRLIALNDNVDTIHGEDEFTPFRNIMNEWYARDTSKKIRSAFKAKNLAGKHTSSSVPYGYLKSPDDKNQWIVDPVASKIVKRIFSMAMEGKGPYQIAKILSDEKIEVPAYYHQKLGIGLWKTREIMKPYTWGSSTIVHILCNPSYCPGFATMLLGYVPIAIAILISFFVEKAPSVLQIVIAIPCSLGLGYFSLPFMERICKNENSPYAYDWGDGYFEKFALQQD